VWNALTSRICRRKIAAGDGYDVGAREVSARARVFDSLGPAADSGCRTAGRLSALRRNSGQVSPSYVTLCWRHAGRGVRVRCLRGALTLTLGGLAAELDAQLTVGGKGNV
jgi:hypothetical protein